MSKRQRHSDNYFHLHGYQQVTPQGPGLQGNHPQGPELQGNVHQGLLGNIQIEYEYDYGLLGNVPRGHEGSSQIPGVPGNGPRGPHLMENSRPKTSQGFGPPGCFSANAQRQSLASARSRPTTNKPSGQMMGIPPLNYRPPMTQGGPSNYRRPITRGPGLMGVAPPDFGPQTTKCGPGNMAVSPPSYRRPTTRGPGLMGVAPPSFGPSTTQYVPDMTGVTPPNDRPPPTRGPGLMGVPPPSFGPSTIQERPGMMPVPPPSYGFPASRGPSLTGVRLPSFDPSTAKRGAPPTIYGSSANVLEIRSPSYEPLTPPRKRRVAAGEDLAGYKPRKGYGSGQSSTSFVPALNKAKFSSSLEPALNKANANLAPLGARGGRGALGYESRGGNLLPSSAFAARDAQDPSSSFRPVQSLHKSFAQGVSSESVEVRSPGMAPGSENELPWKAEIRELKQYVCKLQNEKSQLNNHIVKLVNQNSRLFTTKESDVEIKNAITQQVFNQHSHELGEKELKQIVEKVYAQMKPRNIFPNQAIQSSCGGNGYGLHPVQDKISVDSRGNASKDYSDDDEIQIIEPVKQESLDPYDQMDMDDLVNLLKNFKELDDDEQKSLLAYMKKLEKKFPEKARILNAKYRSVM